MGGGSGTTGGGGGTGLTIDAGTPPTVTVSSGSCQMVTPCSGNLVGTWHYTGACVDDPLSDVRTLCPSISVVNSTSTLTGFAVFSATALTRQVSTTYTTTINLPASCAALGCATIESFLRASVPTATCTAAGAGCNCTLSGSSTLNETGSYTVSNGVVTETTGSTVRTFDACVTNGTSLRLRESSATAGTERGTSTLTKQ